MLPESREKDNVGSKRRSRPPKFRSATLPLGLHPAQVIRSNLGDTRGAVYLPGSDSPPTKSTGIRLDISMFATPHEAKEPALSGSHKSILFSRSVPNLTSIHAFAERGNEASDRRPSSLEESIVEGISNPTISLSCLLTGHHNSRETDYSVEPETCFLGEVEVKLGTMHEFSDTSSGPQAMPRDPWTHYTKPDKPNTSENLCRSNRCDQVFLDPFTGEATPSHRKPSETSDISSYLRQNAFAGHRDTLARFDRVSNDLNDLNDQTDSSDDGSDSNISEVLSIETNVSLTDRQVELSRQGVNWEQFESLPDVIIQSVLQYLSFDDYKSARLTCRGWLVALPQPKLPPTSGPRGNTLQQDCRHLAQRPDIYVPYDQRLNSRETDIDELLYNTRRTCPGASGNASQEIGITRERSSCQDDEPRRVRFRGLDAP